MDKFKSNRVFFIMMGVFVVVLIASGVYLWMESGKTTESGKTLQSKKGQLHLLKNEDPTKSHVELLEGIREDVQGSYKRILETLSTWNDYGTESLAVTEILATIRDDIGYTEIRESMIRDWIDKEDLKAFQAPSNIYYVYREDFEGFIDRAKKGLLEDSVPEEFVKKLIEANSVLNITETPTLFLGNLQTVQKEIEAFARAKKVIINKQAKDLSFYKYLGSNTPPNREIDLLSLIKQRSAMRDIMYLLIESGVFEISSIDLTRKAEGSETRSSFFTTQEFDISFVATYPSIAKFLKMVLEPGPRKQLITTKPGARELLPRNMFVVKDIMYKSEEAEIENQLEREHKAREDKKKKDEEAAARRAREGTTRETARNSRTVGGIGYNPYASGLMGASRGTGIDPRTGTSRSSRGRSKDKFQIYKDLMKAQTKRTKELPGRRPQHNILNVTMRISFVDLLSEITGEETKKQALQGFMMR